MDAVKRRKEILKLFEKTGEIFTASALAEKYGVTRQIIVSDIALLRANGNTIISEKRGYYIPKEKTKGIKGIVACKHDLSRTLEELFVLVDNGAKVINVIVDHPIYGQLTGELNISSRYDAEEFVRSVKELGASSLCELTDGVHFHTIICPDENALVRIEDELRRKGLLIV